MIDWAIADEAALALVRALAVGALAAWVAAGLAAGRLGALRALALISLAATPALLPGHAYASTQLGVLTTPWLAECVYVGLLIGRGLPWALAVRLLARPRLDRESLALLRLRPARGALAWRLWLRGPAGLALASAGPPALLALADFELATLLARTSWTGVLFDAQTGGLPLRACLALAIVPAALQGVLLLATLALLAVSARAAEAPLERRGAPRAWATLALAALWLLAVAAPLAVIAPHAGRLLAWHALWRPITSELLASTLLALVAAPLAWGAASALLERPRPTALAAALAPGLLGSLTLSLLTLAAIQLGALRALRETPLPLLAVQVALLLPPALALRALLLPGAARAGRAAADLLARSGDAAQRAAGRRLAWRLGGGQALLAQILLFTLAYVELTAASLLAPSGMRPIFGWLYNQAHYGASAGLAPLLLAALVPPLALIAGGLVLYRAWSR